VAVSDERYDILDEAAPMDVFERLHELGALDAMTPEGVGSRELIGRLRSCTDALRQFAPQLERPVAPRSAYVCAIAGTGDRVAAERWIRHYRVGKETAAAAVAFVARCEPVMRSLRDRRGMRDSRLYRLLDELPIEAVVCVWGIGDALVRERVERFTFTLMKQKVAVTGRDLIGMGAVPGGEFSAILAQARDDLLDGRATGRDAELANLRRLAARAGILPRKGRA